MRSMACSSQPQWADTGSSKTVRVGEVGDVVPFAVPGASARRACRVETPPTTRWGYSRRSAPTSAAAGRADDPRRLLPDRKAFPASRRRAAARYRERGPSPGAVSPRVGRAWRWPWNQFHVEHAGRLSESRVSRKRVTVAHDRMSIALEMAVNHLILVEVACRSRGLSFRRPVARS